MTDRANLEINFDRRYTTGCYMITTVDQVTTEPTDLKTCLVVAPGTNESFVRIATSTELTTLPALPSAVNRLKSTTYGALVPVNGDIVTVGLSGYVIPDLWVELFGYAGTHVYTVTDATDPFNVEVTPAFPAFGSGISLSVTRGGLDVIAVATPATDGIADRFAVAPAALYLAAQHHDLVSLDVDVALNFIAARRAEAQSLVDDLNQDSYWIGSTDEVFQ